MPLLQFEIQSDDIDSFNGQYEQGHTFNITSSPDLIGSTFNVINIVPKRVDMSKYRLESNYNDDLSIHYNPPSDTVVEDYAFEIISPSSNYRASLYVWDTHYKKFINLFNIELK